MTTSRPSSTRPDDEPSRAPSLCWIPLDEATARWGLFGATDATSPYASAAVGHAFAALSHERMALRHQIAAQQAEGSTLPHQGTGVLRIWSESYRERESCVDTLIQAVRSWQQAALSLDLYADALALLDQPLAEVETLLLDALAQRARLGRLIAETLVTHAFRYEQRMRHPQRGGACS